MSTDRGYLNLVSHLNRQSTNLPLTTVLGSVAHHLARVQPSATPLAATVISSLLFRAPSYPALDGLLTACRHAVHLKLKVLRDEPAGLFARGVPARAAEWAAQVLKGLQGGHAVLRLACCAGLLQGMADTEEELKLEGSAVRRGVEEEFVVALAEVVEYASASSDPWEAEFRSKAQREQDAIPAALVIASRSLSFVASHRLGALPLLSLCRVLQSSLTEAFREGTFLQGLHASAVSSGAGKLSISADSEFSRNVGETAKGLLLAHMATISAMYARAIAVLADSRPSEAWLAITELVYTLRQLTGAVEDGWSRNPLAGVEDEESLVPQTQELAIKVWTILKTLLFTCIRLLQQVLNVVLFVPPGSSVSTPEPSPQQLSPFDITHATLKTLSQLSFVLPRFGGVSSTASSALPELLKTFYTALDVLSASPSESRVLVRTLQQEVHSTRQKGLPSNVVKAKEAYALACVEQLVSVLDGTTMRDDVWPMCEPHLNDSKHRETYESAHSVMLAMFSAHAKKRRAGESSNAAQVSKFQGADPAAEISPSERGVAEAEEEQLPFAEQVVPAYAKCLIDNSHPDKLNTTQLCMAYAALVGCASVFGSSRTNAALEDGTARARTPEGDAYAWLCIELLLDAVMAYTTTPLGDGEKEHRQKLLLALVSTIPSVSLRLLPRLLQSILDMLDTCSVSSPVEDDQLQDERDARNEVAKALFEELLKVGDDEKEYAMRWWGEHKAWLADWVEDRKGAQSEGVESQAPRSGKGKEREVAARL